MASPFKFLQKHFHKFCKLLVFNGYLNKSPTRLNKEICLPTLGQTKNWKTQGICTRSVVFVKICINMLKLRFCMSVRVFVKKMNNLGEGGALS